MKYSKSIIIFSFLAVISVVACKTKKAATTNVENIEAKACDGKVTFEMLQPLLAKDCTTSGCHDESKKRMNFKIYANLKNFGEKGDVSREVVVNKNMPPHQKLSGEELRQFRCWIEGGMLEK
jgi:hypothetical protein